MKNARKLTVSRSWKNRRSIPQIRLSGDWLRQLGFLPGYSVVLSTENECIVIRPHQVA